MHINKRFLYLVTFLSFSAGWMGCQKSSNSGAVSAPTKKVLFHCPMHPKYISDKPGDCPICGMRLVPIDADSPTAPSSTVSGQAPVQMSQDRVQLIGVKTSLVEKRDLVKSIRTSARVAYDPALYSAIIEHQQAIMALQKSRAGDSSENSAEAEATVKASRLRLRQMGLAESQIDGITTDYDASNLLQSHAGGRMWIYADLYEDEINLVKPDQPVALSAPSFPGRTFPGKVRGIDTVVNSETRTMRARIEVLNPTGELKPDMFFQAAIQVSLGKCMAIPTTALLDSGTRQMVFVQTEPGHFSPREVKVGRTADDWTEVVSGLDEGETVVTSANFLIDSESKIKAAAQGQ